MKESFHLLFKWYFRIRNFPCHFIRNRSFCYFDRRFQCRILVFQSVHRRDAAAAANGWIAKSQSLENEIPVDLVFRQFFFRKLQKFPVEAAVLLGKVRVCLAGPSPKQGGGQRRGIAEKRGNLCCFPSGTVI